MKSERKERKGKWIDTVAGDPGWIKHSQRRTAKASCRPTGGETKFKTY